MAHPTILVPISPIKITGPHLNFVANAPGSKPGPCLGVSLSWVAPATKWTGWTPPSQTEVNTYLSFAERMGIRIIEIPLLSQQLDAQPTPAAMVGEFFRQKNKNREDFTLIARAMLHPPDGSAPAEDKSAVLSQQLSEFTDLFGRAELLTLANPKADDLRHQSPLERTIDALQKAGKIKATSTSFYNMKTFLTIALELLLWTDFFQIKADLTFLDGMGNTFPVLKERGKFLSVYVPPEKPSESEPDLQLYQQLASNPALDFVLTGTRTQLFSIWPCFKSRD